MADPKAFAGVARVPFLTLPVTLIAAGGAAAAYSGTFSWPRTIVALVGLVALHIAVNVLNEVSDMRTGIDLNTERTPFSGGSGTLPSGALSKRTAFIFGLGAAAVGLAVGVWFFTLVGWVLLPFMALGAFLVLGYSDLLTRVGVGELAAGLGLGGLPVAGTALVQAGVISPAAIAAAIPATLMTFNLLLLNEFPDETADRAGGRRHLVIRLGRSGAAKLYAVAGILTPISIVVAVVLNVLPLLALVAVLPSLFLLKPISWAFKAPSEAVPIPALAANVQWNLSTNVVLAVMLVVGTLM